MKKLVVLSGAGMSAESGVATFRDANGLWEGHDVMEVATPQGFEKNPELVYQFYNERRRQLKEVKPNKGHLLLHELEKEYEVTIITQNVDDLHERAGSSHVLHLHGELRKVRSTKEENYILTWEEDLNATDLDPKGNPMRPHIVWFGEEVPMLETAISEVQKAEILVIIGTSLQVYPAASLYEFAPADIPIYYIDPRPASNVPGTIRLIKQGASAGVRTLKEQLNVCRIP